MTFCALFTKLWRVDKVLQFRRRAVSISNVIKPLVVVMALAIAILTAWTVVDPYHWERVVISEIPAESYGECASKYWWAWFGPLTGIIFVSEAVTSKLSLASERFVFCFKPRSNVSLVSTTWQCTSPGRPKMFLKTSEIRLP